MKQLILFFTTAIVAFGATAQQFDDFFDGRTLRLDYVFAGNHDAAIRAAIVYSLFSSCKAASIEPREWLEDILVRLPAYNGDIGALLPCNWQKVAATCSE